MSTTTVATQTFNRQNREIAVSERQRKAAKKAWRTRRRRAKPTSVQLEVLRRLDQAGCQLEMHFTDFGQFCRLRSSQARCRLRLTMSTAEALRNRGWIECVEKREVRDTCTHKATGTVWHWSKYVVWELSEKGRKILARNQEPNVR